MKLITKSSWIETLILSLSYKDISKSPESYIKKHEDMFNPLEKAYFIRYWNQVASNLKTIKKPKDFTEPEKLIKAFEDILD